jgi:hypothetical protein
VACGVFQRWDGGFFQAVGLDSEIGHYLLQATSLWLKISGDGFETRIVDGILQIKAESEMLGDLKAPSPFTDDGRFDTGDLVTLNGECIRMYGRLSELLDQDHSACGFGFDLKPKRFEKFHITRRGLKGFAPH